MKKNKKIKPKRVEQFSDALSFLNFLPSRPIYNERKKEASHTLPYSCTSTA